MKVWIVVGWWSEDSWSKTDRAEHILGVFATKEAAEKELAALDLLRFEQRLVAYDSLGIVEHVVLE